MTARNLLDGTRGVPFRVIATEVQVGSGTGSEALRSGVLVPDAIAIAIAIAIGNGHQLAAVVTLRAVAGRYRAQGSFSSAVPTRGSADFFVDALDLVLSTGI